MNSDLETARDLRAAADYLRTHGKLDDGGFGVDGGPRCVIGALGSVAAKCEPIVDIRYAAKHPGWIGEWFDAAQLYAQSLGFSDVGAVYRWSDASAIEVVLDRLESAALNLEIRALAATDKPAEVETPQGLEVLVNS